MTKKNNKKIAKKEETENDEYSEEDFDINDEIDEDEIEEEFEEEENIIIEAEAEVETDGDKCALEEIIEYENEIEEEKIAKIGNEYVSKENRISVNRLTKYEMVRILGERIKQLTMGAKPLIKNYKGLSYDKIAEEEFKRNMIPFKIKRPLPNGKFELWTLDELNKEHLLALLE